MVFDGQGCSLSLFSYFKYIYDFTAVIYTLYNFGY